MPDIFYNRAGRLRSVWRLAVFAVVLFIALNVFVLGTEFALALLLSRETYRWLLVESNWGFVVQSVLYFAAAALAGWVCGLALEELPWRALGWALHRGWLRDTLCGLIVGGASVCIAALVGVFAGGYRFTLPESFDAAALSRTIVYSGLVFLLGAASEEMIFRSYPLQTLMRSWPVWVALIPVSVPFALVHLYNPNVAPGFTLANTVLAGVWLAVAYWRTRSLWFPFGVHWGWNWMQGAILGSPVSGITRITPDPLLHFADAGPRWMGGGSYGIEGGAACTLALIISILFVWRTRLLSATPELRQYTDGENPNPEASHITST
ncbi:MAG: protease family protein [Acidobacteriota bacterium]|jgi:membrane protease YdiL (CAAX protease family)|nr:protease family protein [Acidobacteriota bacterium]